MMKAVIVLHPKGLEYNGQDSYEDVVKKLRSFVVDISQIVRPKGNATPFIKDEIHFSESIFSVPIYKKKTLFDIANEEFVGSEADLFYSFFDSESYFEEMPYEVLQEKTIFESDETDCTAIAVLNALPKVFHDESERRAWENEKNRNYISFDRYEVVYDRHSWLYFRRQILGNHPGSEEDFISQCILYFDSLIFSNDCVTSITGYLDKIPRRFVYYLSCINDNLKTEYCKVYRKEGKININSFLEEFSGKYSFDKSGSMEMDTPNKENYTFAFSDGSQGDSVTKICCDAHVKIQYFDSNCQLPEAKRGEKCHGRIYLHLGDPNDLTDKVKVGSIGRHV